MKKQLLLFSVLFCTLLSQAQVTKSVYLETPGTLSQKLTSQEKSSVTQLILSGQFNYLDLDVIRTMSQLTMIDLSSTTPESVEPRFYNSDFHASIILPSHLQAIGLWNFNNCPNLTNIYFPKSVTNIYFYWQSCNATINIDTENPYYTSVDGIIYNKDISQLFYYPNSKVGEFVVPSSVTHIAGGAIYEHENITSVSFPQSLATLDTCILRFCPNLTDVRVYANTPPTSSKYCFYHIPASCKLHVPIGALSAYSNSENWRYFTNIVEDLTFVSAQNIDINSNNGTPASIEIKSNSSWSASSNESWLTVTATAASPLKSATISSSINGNGSLTISTQPNLTGITRTATVSITENSTVTRTITVTQAPSLTTDIKQPLQPELMITPNPVVDKIHLNVGDENTMIEVTDMNGIIMIKKQISGNADIDLSQLQSGIYLVKVKNQTTRIVKK